MQALHLSAVDGLGNESLALGLGGVVNGSGHGPPTSLGVPGRWDCYRASVPGGLFSCEVSDVAMVFGELLAQPSQHGGGEVDRFGDGLGLGSSRMPCVGSHGRVPDSES